MRSSTFSFSGSPEGPWLRTWLLALGLVVALLAAWEGTLRYLGYRPTVVDDKALWAIQRDRVYSHPGEKTLVLLGDCRMQLDSVPRLLAQQFPGHRVVQLAVEQTSPVATLRDLAADGRFNGLVICALNARLLCEDLWDTQQAYVDYYHKKYTLNEKLNRLLSAALQQNLTLLHPELRLDRLIVHGVQMGRLPSPYYVETHADRSRPGGLLQRRHRRSSPVHARSGALAVRQPDAARTRRMARARQEIGGLGSGDPEAGRRRDFHAVSHDRRTPALRRIHLPQV